MSQIIRLFRNTASRVYKRKNDEESRELRPMQDEIDIVYNSTCLSIHKACGVGDEKAVRWYMENTPHDINTPDKDGRLPIFYAIRQNNVAILKTLINAGADLNLLALLREGIDASAMHFASKFNHPECLRHILEFGGHADIRNIFGQAPLHDVARDKLEECAILLIKIGKADPNIVDNDNVTPLHLVATKGNGEHREAVTKLLLDNGGDPFIEDHQGNTAFHEAAENGVDDVMRMLIDHKYASGTKMFTKSTRIADVLNKPRKDGYNCLHLAVKNGHDKVIQLCIDHKADVNLKSSTGDAPLILASDEGHLQACKILLENGADLHVTDKKKGFAMHRAASKGHVDCLTYLIGKGTSIDVPQLCGPALLAATFNKKSATVKFLLESGATPTKRNLFWDTCLHLAVGNGDIESIKNIMEHCGKTLLEMPDREGKTALHVAAQNGDPEVMKILLPYNPEIKAKECNGKCPIHIAAEYGNIDCVKMFLDADPSCVHATDFMWRTPLHLANSVASKDKNVTKLLLDYGADPNARDDRRWTPLLYVAYNGCACSTEYLVEAGANMNEWDKNKMTALHIAASQNKSNACRMLLEHGADPSIRNSEGLACLDIALKYHFHEVCMAIISCDRWREAIVSLTTMETCLTVSPQTAKAILDKCVVYSGNEFDTDYKITYHFDLLDPHPDENEVYYGPMVMKIARRNGLLTHPLTKKLLEVNWRNGVRYVYYPSMGLIAFVFFFMVQFVLYNRGILAECYKKSMVNNTVPKEFNTDDSFCVSKVSYSQNQMIICRSLILIFFLLYLMNEIKQMIHEKWGYFADIMNLLDLSVSLTFLYFVHIPSVNPIPYSRFILGVAGIFGYSFLLFLWTRGLSRYGIYITMFLEVLATLLRVLLGFSLLFVGFALTFYFLFLHSVFDHISFNNPLNSHLKVMAMMLGELDYSGFREDARALPGDREVFAVIVFLIFCFTMAVVVNNLLIGLAVGDIESVQANAEIKLLSLQVSQIIDYRAAMPSFLRKKFYMATFTETPNKKDNCSDQQPGEAKYQKMMNKKKKRKDGKTVFESMIDISLLPNNKPKKNINI